jgi:hypothetical protein
VIAPAVSLRQSMLNAEFSHLHRLMCQIRDLLLNEDEWEWASWLDRGVALMEQRDPNVVGRFLAAFGGYQSIDHEFGVSINRGDSCSDKSDAAKSAISTLLSEAHSIATKILPRTQTQK